MFRPQYPKEVFDYLLALTRNRACAWDAATGNGQVAHVLAGYFEKVVATDISSNQLAHALEHKNIEYRQERAEACSCGDHVFDLVVIAQAIHWLHFDSFYREVKRTLKSDGLFVVMGYGLFSVNEAVDAVIAHFYTETLRNCWDPERRYLDENYATIPFPFQELNTPAFEMKYEWKLDQLTGFLNTWSAVQHYISKFGNNPVDEVRKHLETVWPSQQINTVHFPLLLRVGRNQ